MKKETRLIMKHRLEKCIQWYRAYSAIVVMIPVVIVGVLAMVVYYIDIGVLTDEYERIHLIFFISCGIILLAGGLFGFLQFDFNNVIMLNVFHSGKSVKFIGNINAYDTESVKITKLNSVVTWRESRINIILGNNVVFITPYEQS